MYNDDIMSKTLALNSDIRLAIIEWFARGFTVRRIRAKLIKTYDYESSEKELMRLSIAYADDVEQARREISEMVLERGLASKSERVLRLSELAESWEDRAHTEVKAAGVYQRTLKQIHDEVEPLGLTIVVPSSDPWGQLMLELKEARSQSTPIPTPDKDPDQKKST